MGRFKWLEFDDGCSPKAATSPEEEAVDEVVCLERGDRCFRAESFERALYFYSLALRYQINLERAWVGQVRCLLAMHEDVEARTWAERGLERFPGSADLLAAKGVSLARTRGPTAGMRASDQALEARGGTEYVWLSRAEVLFIAAAPDSAVRCFAKALEIADDDWHCHYQIAALLLSAGEPARAVAYLNDATHRDPKQVLPWIKMAECRERMGDLAGAKAALYHALELRPGDRNLRHRVHEVERVGWLRRSGRALSARLGRLLRR